MKAFLFFLILMGGLVSAFAAIAQDKEREPNPKLNEYRATGETQHCVSRNRIQRTEVLDDYTILFHMRGGRVLKNELPYRCFGLGFERGFGYSPSAGLLCNVDIITVLSDSGLNTSCGLGDFELLEKIEPKKSPNSDPE